jgi:hypothetical protein
MNATELSQIVVDPEDKSTDLLLKLSYETDTKDPLWPTIKVWIGKSLHPLGIHTWVRWRHYDKASDQVIDMNGVVCCFCSKAQLKGTK